MESLRRIVLRLRVPAGIVALGGLFLSGLVHVASLRGADVAFTWPSVWCLQYALVPIVVLAVLTASAMAEQSRLNFRSFLALVPAPAWIVLAAGLLYALGTLLTLAPVSGGGDPVIVDGRFYFNDHGTMREVGEDQFHHQRSVSLRLFSSVWIYLYLFSAIYLLAAKRRPIASTVERSRANR